MDGVLVPFGNLDHVAVHGQLPDRVEKRAEAISEEAADTLEEIISLLKASATEVEVVISSSWRRGKSTRFFEMLFAEAQMHKTVKHLVGQTSYFPDNGREKEIIEWLDHRDALPKESLVLDDVDGFDVLQPQQIQPDPDEGLNASHVDEAISILS
jgi:hypothetical protein